MPLFEYACPACGEECELLVRKGEEVVCPACGSRDLKRLQSLPSVRSDGSHARAMAAAKRRDAKQGSERMRQQAEYELKHDQEDH